MSTRSVPWASRRARRSRLSRVGAAMIIVRPGPSPAAPGRRGETAALLDQRCRNIRRVVDEGEDSVEAVGVLVARGHGEVFVAAQQLADAELAQVGLVLGKSCATTVAPARAASWTARMPTARSRRTAPTRTLNAHVR